MNEWHRDPELTDTCSANPLAGIDLVQFLLEGAAKSATASATIGVAFMVTGGSSAERGKSFGARWVLSVVAERVCRRS